MWASNAQASLHWSLSVRFTNDDGGVQYIELQNTSPNAEEFLNGITISVKSAKSSQTHNLTLPQDLPGIAPFEKYLIGTAGLEAAGGPAPDFIMPDGFLFSGRNVLSAFGLTLGSYFPSEQLNWPSSSSGLGTSHAPLIVQPSDSPRIVQQPTSSPLPSVTQIFTSSQDVAAIRLASPQSSAAGAVPVVDAPLVSAASWATTPEVLVVPEPTNGVLLLAAAGFLGGLRAFRRCARRRLHQATMYVRDVK